MNAQFIVLMTVTKEDRQIPEQKIRELYNIFVY